jgi:hypothetical protein
LQRPGRRYRFRHTPHILVEVGVGALHGRSGLFEQQVPMELRPLDQVGVESPLNTGAQTLAPFEVTNGAHRARALPSHPFPVPRRRERPAVPDLTGPDRRDNAAASAQPRRPGGQQPPDMPRAT